MLAEEEEATEEEEEEEEEAGDDKAKKTKEVKTTSWERINNNVAIWARSPKSVTDEEYQAFYKAVSKVRR